MVKVLLVAPLDPEVFGKLKFLLGGENTYARTLLNNAPAGVKYVHHTDALKEGLIEYLPYQGILGFFVKLRLLPLSAGTQCFKLKSDFDLIHVHSYSIKLVSEAPIPIILSDSSSNYLFLKHYVHWPEWRIRISYFIRRNVFKLLEIVDPDTNTEKAALLIVFSRFSRRIHLQLGISKEKTELIYPCLANPRNPSLRRRSEEINILFIGIWFDRKGGPILLEAFKVLSKKYPKIRLTIVGPVGNRLKNYDLSVRDRILQYNFIPREKILKEFFPKADIFVLVPPVAEGFGFVVLEAMMFGIPAIVSNVYALPELVQNGRTGFVIKPNDLNLLVEKLEILIKHKNIRQRMGENARKSFEKNFSIEAFQERMGNLYKKVLKA